MGSWFNVSDLHSSDAAGSNVLIDEEFQGYEENKIKEEDDYDFLARAIRVNNEKALSAMKSKKYQHV